MKLRGYGDILGFKQSGLKIFKLADPVLNENLFRLAENEIKRIEKNNEDIGVNYAQGYEIEQPKELEHIIQEQKQKNNIA